MSSCAHTETVTILSAVKCSGCGQVWALDDYDKNCPDCEFETHRCGHCNQQLGHSMVHHCPRTYGQ